MDVKRDIKQAMDQLGIDKLRRHQLKPISSICSARDTFVLAPTSSGKSAIYQIPALLHANQITVVLEPTLALMHDQTRKLRVLGIAAEYMDSAMTKSERTDSLKRFQEGKVNILYITPERFVSESFLCILRGMKLFMLVVDECHCVLDWGGSFRSDYLQIGEAINSLSERPVITALTATASKEDIEQICTLLHMKKPAIFENDLYRKNLIFIKKYADDRKAKLTLLYQYLKKYHTGCSIVYCNTKKAVDAVHELLEKRYPGKVCKCHSNMGAAKRASHELQFLKGEKQIMVATSAFGMGVDMGEVDLVIHFNMPLSVTDYVQQAGRAGRQGQKAHCVLLYSDDDYYIDRVILSSIQDDSAKKRALNRLDEMKDYCDDTAHCQTGMLLRSFGQGQKKCCNRCTNCQKARRGGMGS